MRPNPIGPTGRLVIVAAMVKMRGSYARTGCLQWVRDIQLMWIFPFLSLGDDIVFHGCIPAIQPAGPIGDKTKARPNPPGAGRSARSSPTALSAKETTS